MGFFSELFSIFSSNNSSVKEEKNENILDKEIKIDENKFMQESLKRAKLFDDFHHKRILKFNYNNLKNIPLERELNCLEKSFLSYISDWNVDELIHLPLYWTFDYNIDYENLINIFISNGYLKISNYKNDINKLLTNELKIILKKYNLKVSGKKEELINRIKENISIEELQKYFSSSKKFLVLTEKGMESIKNLPISATKDIDFENKQLLLIKNEKFSTVYENIKNREKNKPFPEGVNSLKYFENFTNKMQLKYSEFYKQKILVGENEKYNLDLICSLILGNILGENITKTILIFKRLNGCNLSKEELIEISAPYYTFLLTGKLEYKIVSKERDIYLEKYVKPITISNFFDKYSTLNKNEILFLNYLYSYLIINNFNPNINFNILSNNFIKINYDRYQIGLIKLKGKKFKMQILTLDRVEFIEGDLNYLINKIPYWLDYIEKIK